MSTASVSPLPTPEPTPRSPAFEADLLRLRDAVTELQNSQTSPMNLLFTRLSRRLLGFTWQEARTARQLALEAGLGAAVYLLAPVMATTVTWTWDTAPLWTWLAVAALFGAFQVMGTRLVGEASPLVGNMLQLPAAVEREADLHALVDTARQLWRARRFAPPAAALTAGVLVLSAARGGNAFWSLHVGTLVLLTLMLYEFSEAMVGVFLTVRFYRAESRFAHRLSWLDPLSSRPVQAMLHTWFAGIGPGSPMVVAYGLAVTLLIAPLSIDLVVVPLAGVALIGVVLVVASLVSLRRSVQRIVQHTKDAALESLRERIEALEPRSRELTSDESERLRALLATYAAVRVAPTGPSSTQTLAHAVTALAIPAITLLLAVMSEVYAERLLDQLLP